MTKAQILLDKITKIQTKAVDHDPGNTLYTDLQPLADRCREMIAGGQDPDPVILNQAMDYTQRAVDNYR